MRYYIRALLLRSLAIAMLSSTPLWAITFGQIDNFQDGTTMGWSEGGPSPNPPTNIATGGPGGAGDRYLQNIASGGFGAGSRQVMMNSVQWTGSYSTAHVTQIDMMLANFGGASLPVRFAIEGGPGFTQYASTN